ncbi:hypothetical protein BDY19DRAFT_8862 [Irpex rosettiformis]|uniref:Uncharacterized protein n=1 Tax=Irpex rosettiformis TaxID=378272 RepID=A0ACB8UIK2_9APHY|nr:hypothetical protein BDY19DRAFT_8862 [Irpex rosettiformis]
MWIVIGTRWVPNNEAAEPSKKRKFEEDSRETVADTVKKRHCSPSKAAQPSTAHDTQKKTEKDAIYNGRPIELLQPPITLWHPVFAKFRRLMSIPAETFRFSHDQLDRAKRFIVVSSKIYKQETERHSQLSENSPFARPGCFTERILLNGQVRPDGGASIWVKLPDGTSVEVFSCFTEIKNEVGVGDADPLMQAQSTYRAIYSSELLKPIRMLSCCPSFLIAIAGPHLYVSGAVFANRLICEPLLDGSILIGPQFSSESDDRVSVGIQRVAHLMNALEECISDVEKYYQDLHLNQGESQQRPYLQVQHHLCAPHFRYFTTRDRKRVALEYVERLAQEHTEKAVFKAFAKDDSENSSCLTVVVKFTPKYNQDAHIGLADVGLAPKLWFCERVESVGGWYVIVMDYVEPCEVGTICDHSGAVQALRRAIRILHEDNLVFGDLREPNVLVTEDGTSAMLVDFDWCGKEGEVRYPNDVNLNREAIPWHADVCLGGEMKKEHDKWMFTTMTGEGIEMSES